MSVTMHQLARQSDSANCEKCEGAIVSEIDSPRFDAILFDLGGVLMNNRGLQRLAELTGEENGPALHSKWLTSKWVQAFERGKCDAATFGEGVVTDWGLDLTPAEFVDDFARWPAGPLRERSNWFEAFTGLSRWHALATQTRLTGNSISTVGV
jgi:hypothetical protein